MESIRFDDEGPAASGQIPGGGASGERNTGGAGNRPAEGARHATPGQVFRDERGLPRGAGGDFLGLESSPAEIVQISLDDGASGPREAPAWLLADVEAEARGGAAWTGAGRDRELDQQPEDDVLDALEGLDTLAVDELELDEPGDESKGGGDAGDERVEETRRGERSGRESTARKRGRGALRVAALVLVCAGLGAAGIVGRHALGQRWSAERTEIARAPERIRAPRPAPAGAPAPLPESTYDAASAVASPEAAAASPGPASTDPAVAAGPDGAPGLAARGDVLPELAAPVGSSIEREPASAAVPGAGLEPLRGGAPAALAAVHPMGGAVLGVAAAMAGIELPEAGPAPVASSLSGPEGPYAQLGPGLIGTGEGQPSDAPALPSGVWRVSTAGSQLVPAGTENVSIVWQASEVPMHALSEPVAWLTPAVGNVRVRIDSDDQFEGRLYSLGAGEVVLDTQIGRIRLDGQRVRDVQRILATGEVGPGAETDLLPGERVRARTPGGWIVGRVVARDGNKVTLLTEFGGRITLESPELEPLARTSKVVSID